MFHLLTGMTMRMRKVGLLYEDMCYVPPPNSYLCLCTCAKTGGRMRIIWAMFQLLKVKCHEVVCQLTSFSIVLRIPNPRSQV
jgi:hypothetical protein